MSFFGRIAIWSLVGLVTLDSFGVDITTFVAGLGVGGIAVAFALQSILADIFSSVAILLDKPFVVGDVITVGDNTGEVQSIGLKTTRLKSVSGEQVVISNNDLLSSRIHNFKRMSERRILFTVQVTYATKLEQLELIPKILQEAVEQHEQTRFRRAHFKAFGDFSLIFECEYFMLEPDHMLYINTHQAVNLHIFKRFHEEGIEFANSTQTHLAALDLLPPTLKVSADHTPPKNNG
jgi:small-conductance mechanosensitive channel